MSKIVKYLFLALFIIPCVHGAQITIVGCGYVGLTMAALFKQHGHDVLCVDRDTEKINRLNTKELPFFEPGLSELLFHSSAGTVRFESSVSKMYESPIIYICVGTPSCKDGASDCSDLYNVFDDIIRHCSSDNADKIICVKSTVPPGTMRALHTRLRAEKNDHLQLVYNPEFMREGSALRDICGSNPIVLAGESADALQKIECLYNRAKHSLVKIIKTNFETAELLKYSWTSFSAIRIAYVNELALLCRELNADISTIVQGLALSEELLPTKTLVPGPGFGGSCLPKDTISFSKVLEQKGLSSCIIHRAIESNKNHIKRLIDELLSLLPVTKTQRIVTLLGLSFKANTSDIRNAPSLEIIKTLIDNGIVVNAYDLHAMGDMKKVFDQIHCFDSPYDAIRDTDCIIVLTDWHEIKNLDLHKVSQLCNKKLLIDTRNIFDPETLKKYGFTYRNMGKL